MPCLGQMCSSRRLMQRVLQPSPAPGPGWESSRLSSPGQAEAQSLAWGWGEKGTRREQRGELLSCQSLPAQLGKGWRNPSPLGCRAAPGAVRFPRVFPLRTVLSPSSLFPDGGCSLSCRRR